MASVREHYDQHLGPIYEWMLGDFDDAIAAARTELRAAAVTGGDAHVAVDLGAGLGAHAIALAEAGCAVTAVDTCAPLLRALRARAGHLRIRTIEDDVLHFDRHCDTPLDVALCMGDTLTHLPSRHAVAHLLELVAERLAPEGVFITTFRDYHAEHPLGVGRIIPVRQDQHRLLTCVLEYGRTRVTVHDLVHERTDTGWTLRVSRYQKLRLDPAWTRAELDRHGLATTLDLVPGGMVRITARHIGWRHSQ